MEVEGKNGMPSLEEFSGFQFIPIGKISFTKIWSGIDGLIILVYIWFTNNTRIVPQKVTYLQEILLL